MFSFDIFDRFKKLTSGFDRRTWIEWWVWKDKISEQNKWFFFRKTWSTGWNLTRAMFTYDFDRAMAILAIFEHCCTFVARSSWAQAKNNGSTYLKINKKKNWKNLGKHWKPLKIYLEKFQSLKPFNQNNKKTKFSVKIIHFYLIL